MNRIARITVVAVTLLALTAVPALAAPVFNTHLSGDQMVPARATKATGQVMLKVSADQTSVDYRITASNIENVIFAKVYLAPVGATGPEVAALFGPVAPGGGKTTGVLASGTLTAANLVGPLAGQSIADLITRIQAGEIYVSVATDDGLAPTDERSGDFSSGEIRGQLR